MDERPIYIGVNLPGKHGAVDQAVVDAAIAAGFDLVTAKLTTRSFRRRVQALCAGELDDASMSSTGSTNGSVGNGTSTAVSVNVSPLMAEDVQVFPGNHVENTIALSAPWVELDARHSVLAKVSLQVLEQEIKYARFCGLPYVVVPGPKRRTNLALYARGIASLLRQVPQIKVLLHTTASEEFRNNSPPPDLLSTWEVWDAVRRMTDYPSNLSLALEISRHPLPSYVTDRWFCEPISMLIVSGASTFVPNAKGFPVLPKQVQSMVQRFASKEPFVLLKDTEGTDSESCLIYLRHLLAQKAPQPPQTFSGYGDVLQAPLQPVGDDLDSLTYGVFEQDTAKYDAYERAITAALGNELEQLRYLVVVVAGAGRGPLVDRVLAACSRARRGVKVYAVEKNLAAVAYLQSRKVSREWGPSVEVVGADMRSWKAPQRAHLIVSELLGSLGDNELSPECLTALQPVLEPHGVMIPRSYIAWMAPVCSPRLYTAARTNAAHAQTGPPLSLTSPTSSQQQDIRRLQTPYVVYLQQAEQLAEPQTLWQFQHPDSPGQSLDRYSKLTFSAPYRTTVHGLAGYFEAQLYPGVELSTCPLTKDTASPDLFSWFPMWFPLMTPLCIPENGEIDVSVWRLSTSQSMWYEWVAEVFTKDGHRRSRGGSTQLHNCGGTSFSIRP